MKRPRMAFEDISEVEPQNLHENFDLEFWRNLFEGCAGVISHHKPKIFVFQNMSGKFLQIKEKTGRISSLLSIS